MRDIFTIPDKKLLSFVISPLLFVKSYKCQDLTTVDNGTSAIIAVTALSSDKKPRNNEKISHLSAVNDRHSRANSCKQSLNDY
ncbi:MAG TPA: hypothetical protein DEV81_02405 [Cyanobacteria bacterium UBA11049]|nr:hypothetical protein [Cyanobacteria bacterium UBA11049]